MPFHRLLYRSESALSGSAESIELQVASIIERSKAANQAAGLTGALLLSTDVFIQVLEGPIEAVEATFERICRDLRHRRVRLLELAAGEQRMFEEWAMVRVQPNADLARLYPNLDAPHHARLDISTSSAAIRTMRAVLVTQPDAENAGESLRA